MGSHRAERRGPRSRPSESTPEKYAGRRVAGRSVPTGTAVTNLATESLQVQVVAELLPAPSVSRDTTTLFSDHEATAALPLVTAPAPTQPGKRKAVKHAGNRGPLFKGLPSAPVLVGLAALAVSAGGAVAAGDTDLATATPRLAQAGALSGASDGSHVEVAAGASGAASGTTSGATASGAPAAAPTLPDRGEIISRDSRRDALEDAADAELVAAAEKQNQQRNAALAQFAQQAEKQAAKIKLNQWVLPLSSYRLTATYGQYGLWSSYHTGLDFAAPTGSTIVSVANGVVTETGYDGAYGNKTVVTLDDGTEIWYCHQTSIGVSPGDVVRAGEAIGSVGSTGNVTGPHLHLEVRPGGGDPVDPYSALSVHGVTP